MNLAMSPRLYLWLFFGLVFVVLAIITARRRACVRCDGEPLPTAQQTDGDRDRCPGVHGALHRQQLHHQPTPGAVLQRARDAACVMGREVARNSPAVRWCDAGVW